MYILQFTEALILLNEIFNFFYLIGAVMKKTLSYVSVF